MATRYYEGTDGIEYAYEVEDQDKPVDDLECLTCGIRFDSWSHGGEVCPLCESQDLFWFRQAQALED